MADEIRTGIRLEGKDDVSDVLDRIAGNTDDMADDMVADLKRTERAAESAGEGMAGVGTAVAGAMAVVELAKKAFEVFSATITASVEKSLELRDENDLQKRSWIAMKDAVGELQATLGDALIPAVLQVFEAIKPVIEALQAWLANTDILQQTMENVLIPVIRGVVAAVFGLQQAYQAVIAAGAALIEAAAAQFAEMLGMAREAAEAFGADGIAGTIEGAQRSVEGFGDRMGETSRKALEEIGELQSSWMAMDDAIVKGAVEGAKQYGVEIDRVTAKQGRLREEAEAAAQTMNDGAEQLEGRLIKLNQQQAKFRVENNELADEWARRSEEMSDRAIAVGDNFAASITSGADAAEAAAGSILRAFVDMIKQQFQALIAKAMAEAIAGHAGIPFVGVAIGAAAGAAAIGIIEGLMSNIPGFALGGRVPGQGLSRDSVLTVQQPGELNVNPLGQMYLERALRGAFGETSGGGGQQVVMQNRFELVSLMPFATAAALDQAVEESILPAQRRLAELGTT